MKKVFVSAVLILLSSLTAFASDENSMSPAIPTQEKLNQVGCLATAYLDQADAMLKRQSQLTQEAGSLLASSPEAYMAAAEAAKIELDLKQLRSAWGRVYSSGFKTSVISAELGVIGERCK